MQIWDAIWINAMIMTCEAGLMVSQGGIAVKDKKIAWIGKMKDLNGQPNQLAKQVFDVEGQLITPGLIDCHTHVVYAGDRAIEFEKRLKGVSYETISKQGGGIKSTVLATRKASDEALYQASLTRVLSLLASGVTTLEIKSGYGLELETELKILRVAKRLGKTLPISVYPTFLGAHALPPEYEQDPDGYIKLVCDVMIPMIAKEKLAEGIDVFCEKIAFNIQQTEKVFKTAQQYGLGIRCHAEQLSHSGSASLAAKYRALSVDHLEYVSEDSIRALAESGTVAVLLPGAFYYLHEKRIPPIALFRTHRVPMAIASDCNPGTSPVLSLLLIMNMASNLFGFTIEEAILAVTLQAAKALGKEQLYGTLKTGKMADFVIWQVTQPVELIYYMGNNPLLKLIKHGSEVAQLQPLSLL